MYKLTIIDPENLQIMADTLTCIGTAGLWCEHERGVMVVRSGDYDTIRDLQSDVPAVTLPIEYTGADVESMYPVSLA